MYATIGKIHLSRIDNDAIRFNTIEYSNAGNSAYIKFLVHRDDASKTLTREVLKLNSDLSSIFAGSVTASSFIGNATSATSVTNGVYTTGTQNIGGLKTFTSKLSNTGGALLEIQNGVDGGSNNGIALWDISNKLYAIYMGQSGGTRSFNGAALVAGNDFISYAVRFRSSSNSNQGFFFENSNEQLLMSINSGTKNIYMGNNLEVGANITCNRVDIAPASGQAVLQLHSTGGRYALNAETNGAFQIYDNDNSRSAFRYFASSDQSSQISGFLRISNQLVINGVSAFYDGTAQNGTDLRANLRITSNLSTVNNDGMYINYGSFWGKSRFKTLCGRNIKPTSCCFS